MTQFLIFVYALINFLFLFLVETSISMLFFIPIFNSKVFFFIHNTLSPFSNIFFFLYVNVAKIRCVSDDDCPKVIRPLVMKCIGIYCNFFMSYEGP